MTQPLVIVPARAGSVGVPGKNFKLLPDGSTLVERAVKIGQQIGQVMLSTDAGIAELVRGMPPPSPRVQFIQRPASLAQSDTPMSAVVSHVLDLVPGPPDQPIVLLQPTVPFRTVAQVQACLDESHLNGSQGLGYAIATVREVPRPFWRAQPMQSYMDLPEPRQSARPLYVFSGTAYVWRRADRWPDAWWPVIEDGQPYLNIDEPSDWAQLVTLLSVQAEG